MKRGYTLLEILIALGLLTVVLTIVSTSVQQYWRFVSLSRTTVAESELARAILEMIARDLRNVFVVGTDPAVEVDTAALTGISDPTLAATAMSSLTLTSETDTSATPESGTIVGTQAGVYGTTEWIQIDTTRLPRGEQGQAKVWRPSASPLTDRVSPSKNVLYYLGRDTGATSFVPSEMEAVDSLGRRMGLDAPACGLFRRAFDRSVTELMVEDGLSESLDIEAEDDLLAVEIEAIEFLYFDPEAGMEGTAGDWVEEWDMDVIGYLPKAVKVTIWMRRLGANESSSEAIALAQTTPGSSTSGVLVYSLVVAIPAFPTASSSGTSSGTEGAAASATAM